MSQMKRLWEMMHYDGLSEAEAIARIVAEREASERSEDEERLPDCALEGMGQLNAFGLEAA